MMRCPKCGKTPIKTVHGMTTHLAGTRPYGGHEMDRDEALKLAKSIEAGTHVPEKPQVVPATSSSPPRAARIEVLAPALSAEAESSFLARLFAQMAGDKALPKYQFERRVDAMLAVLLPDLLAQVIGGRPVYVVSEFPLKKASSNQSTNVDHLYFDDLRDRWFFCEIKTDSRSVQDGQVSTYLDAARRGMRVLVDDIRRIQQASNEFGKYSALLDRVERHPVDRPIEILYLAPGVSESRFDSRVRLLSYDKLSSLQHREHPEVWALFRHHLGPVLG